MNIYKPTAYCTNEYIFEAATLPNANIVTEAIEIYGIVELVLFAEILATFRKLPKLKSR